MAGMIEYFDNRKFKEGFYPAFLVMINPGEFLSLQEELHIFLRAV
jgi:hypothetical protein